MFKKCENLNLILIRFSSYLMILLYQAEIKRMFKNHVKQINHLLIDKKNIIVYNLYIN